MREVIKVKVESLVKYTDDLYRVSEKFFILKDKFDPYLKLWMDYRKENGIESAWLLPDFDDHKKSWRVEAVGGTLAIIGHLTETSMYWTSFTDFAVKEFVRANISHEVLWEMSGLTDKDLLAAYVKG